MPGSRLSRKIFPLFFFLFWVVDEASNETKGCRIGGEGMGKGQRVSLSKKMVERRREQSAGHARRDADDWEMRVRGRSRTGERERYVMS